LIKLSAEEYIKSAAETARTLWGKEAEKARPHIEATAKSTHKVSTTPMKPEQEPVTRLSYGDTP